MPAISTNAIRAFQNKVHSAISTNQKEIKLVEANIDIEKYYYIG